MQSIAHLRHLRMSPRKVRLVAGLIRGMDVAEADAQLRYLPKAASLPVRKLLASAVANAEHNAKLTAANLFIGQIFVNQGPSLKRFRPRAFGRAAAIKKRTSHITIVLDERVPTQVGSHRLATASPTLPTPVMMNDRPRAAKKGVGRVHSEAGEEPTKEGAEKSEPMDVRRKGKHRHQEHEDARSGKKAGGFLKRLVNRRFGEK